MIYLAIFIVVICLVYYYGKNKKTDSTMVYTKTVQPQNLWVDIRN